MTQGRVAQVGPHVAEGRLHMAEQENAVSLAEEVPDDKPKRGDTVEHVVRIETGAFQVSALHDEEARSAFDNIHAPRKVDNVEMVARTHLVGQYIDYTFTGTLK